MEEDATGMSSMIVEPGHEVSGGKNGGSEEGEVETIDGVGGSRGSGGDGVEVATRVGDAVIAKIGEEERGGIGSWPMDGGVVGHDGERVRGVVRGREERKLAIESQHDVDDVGENERNWVGDLLVERVLKDEPVEMEGLRRRRERGGGDDGNKGVGMVEIAEKGRRRGNVIGRFGRGNRRRERND